MPVSFARLYFSYEPLAHSLHTYIGNVLYARVSRGLKITREEHTRGASHVDTFASACCIFHILCRSFYGGAAANFLPHAIFFFFFFFCYTFVPSAKLFAGLVCLLMAVNARIKFGNCLKAHLWQLFILLFYFYFFGGM